MIGKSFEQFYELVHKTSRSKISRTKAEEIYANAGNILIIPEIEPIISIYIKTLINQLELYDGQIQSVEDKIEQIMKLIDSKIMSIEWETDQTNYATKDLTPPAAAQPLGSGVATPAP